ncbi:hypothetical protein [Parendozoicomonas sp. Alg238-R29]|uniref:hypothetical protein n=1 Tax=Parendozoicomonas sp. Alg238-R29 TaxID=2993446 RepID=UPI00248D8B41|nr:hypothetical protein [Parendozoicomonas sp. Alg238-R29]
MVRDYTLIAVVQLSALVYGLYAVALSRPVFTVFVKDRIEIVTPLELDEQDLLNASTKYQSLSWTGPISVCTEPPTNPQEKSALLFSGIAGKDMQFFPKYYRECREGEILSKSFDRERLDTVLKQKSDEEQIYTLPEGDFTWLPARNRFSTWIELYPVDRSESFYLPINPFF